VGLPAEAGLHEGDARNWNEPLLSARVRALNAPSLADKSASGKSGDKSPHSKTLRAVAPPDSVLPSRFVFMAWIFQFLSERVKAVVSR
jgi:hypothetical protein